MQVFVEGIAGLRVVWEVLFVVLGMQEVVPGLFELAALGLSIVMWWFM
jgi:hypothetical protein